MLLNFGAVDWESTVFVNGKEFGTHKGGYDPFSFDITDALKDGKNELVVRVWDPTDAGSQPRGKQVIEARTASGTRPSPASGRRCGWSRCRRRTSRACGSRRTSTRARSSSSSMSRATASQCSIGDRMTVTAMKIAGERQTGQAVPHQDPEIRSCGRPTRRTSTPIDVAALAKQIRQRLRRCGGHLLRHAQDLRRQGRQGHHAAHAQQQARVPDRAARSGLVAGRAAHAADATRR